MTVHCRIKPSHSQLKFNSYDQYCIDRESSSYKKATKAGWVFSEINIAPGLSISDTYQISGKFTCVCGRVEYYSFPLSSEELNGKDTLGIVNGNKIDTVCLLDKIVGAFSEQHLRQDGFTEDQIQQIRTHFKEAV